MNQQMTDLMESAAARLMRPRLNDGESSVGVAMNVTYVAHNLRQPGGGTMRVVPSYKGVSGRMHRFTINVFDESGLIGTAEHTRAVVAERRMLSLAGNRAGNPELLLVG